MPTRVVPVIATVAALGVWASGAFADVGHPLEEQTRITDFGPRGDATFDAEEPASAQGDGVTVIAYVVRMNDGPGPNAGQLAVFARTVGADGTLSDERRISDDFQDAGPLDSGDVEISYSSRSDSFLTVWNQPVDGSSLVRFHRRVLDGAGVPTGAPTAIPGSPGAYSMDFAYDPERDRHLLASTSYVVGLPHRTLLRPDGTVERIGLVYGELRAPANAPGEPPEIIEEATDETARCADPNIGGTVCRDIAATYMPGSDEFLVAIDDADFGARGIETQRLENTGERAGAVTQVGELRRDTLPPAAPGCAIGRNSSGFAGGFDTLDLAHDPDTGQSVVSEVRYPARTPERAMVDAVLLDPLGQLLRRQRVSRFTRGLERPVDPHVVFNPSAGEYRVIWNELPVTGTRTELRSQRIDQNGRRLGAGIQVSTMGPAFDRCVGAFSGSSVYLPAVNRYLTVWAGDENRDGGVDGEFEVYTRLAGAGLPPGIGAPVSAEIDALAGNGLISDAFSRVIQRHVNLSERLRERGLSRASEFVWNLSARRIDFAKPRQIAPQAGERLLRVFNDPVAELGLEPPKPPTDGESPNANLP